MTAFAFYYKNNWGLFSKKTSVEKLKRQRIMTCDFLNHFSLKHYPRIFLDQRLSTRFNEHAT